ncbi:MAG: ABC transporter substrate-binding protein, partial [Ilumatobacteraceae bacterium]|nr:ABC transporter substrate-binding protein [Ilumatobacteraceae bacterium]
MSIIRMSRIRALTAALAATLVLAACGSGSSTPDTTVPEVSLRIVSLSPTATEMLYAIGAGDQVVAVDSYSTFPAETASKVTKMSAFEPNAEAILGYTPDVVLISNDTNKISEQLIAGNPKLQVWTGAAAATLDDVYKQITELGALTGHDKDAETLIESMKTRIAKATENISAPMSPKSYFYELDNTLYSLTSNTFVGALLKPFGFTNIADGVEAGNDYPQLNAEVIAKANPSIIFLADTKCCAQNAAEVSKRPGWAGIDAVKNGQIVELDDDIASRWG